MSNEELLTLLRKMQEYKREMAETFRLLNNEDTARFYEGEAAALGDVICALLSPQIAQALKDNYLTE